MCSRRKRSPEAKKSTHSHFPSKPPPSIGLTSLRALDRVA
jgi:hypothetical protein